MKIRATAAIMECLLEQEVDTVFGYPGGTILNLYDELYNYKDKINHILIKPTGPNEIFHRSHAGFHVLNGEHFFNRRLTAAFEYSKAGLYS